MDSSPTATLPLFHTDDMVASIPVDRSGTRKSTEKFQIMKQKSCAVQGRWHLNSPPHSPKKRAASPFRVRLLTRDSHLELEERCYTTMLRSAVVGRKADLINFLTRRVGHARANLSWRTELEAFTFAAAAATCDQADLSMKFTFARNVPCGNQFTLRLQTIQ